MRTELDWDVNKFLKPEQIDLLIYTRRVATVSHSLFTEALYEEFGLSTLLKRESSYVIESDVKEKIIRNQCIEDADAILMMSRDIMFSDIVNIISNSKITEVANKVILIALNALAMGFLLGRDSEKVKSGMFSEELRKMESLNIIHFLETAKKEAEFELEQNKECQFQDIQDFFDTRIEFSKFIQAYVERDIIPIDVIIPTYEKVLLNVTDESSIFSSLSKEFEKVEEEYIKMREALSDE